MLAVLRFGEVPPHPNPWAPTTLNPPSPPTDWKLPEDRGPVGGGGGRVHCGHLLMSSPCPASTLCPEAPSTITRTLRVQPVTMPLLQTARWRPARLRHPQPPQGQVDGRDDLYLNLTDARGSVLAKPPANGTSEGLAPAEPVQEETDLFSAFQTFYYKGV